MKSFDSTIRQYLLSEALGYNNYKTQDEKMEEVFLNMTALEKSLLGNARYLLNRTTAEINMSSEHVGE